MEREALKLALDLATMHHTDDGYAELRSKVRQFAKEALAQPAQEPVKHWSDCAVHNEPAYLKGECDCGGFATPPQLKPMTEWQPIETAPKDGTYILLGSTDGAWVASYKPVYQSGYRPENPWHSMMLNHAHMGRYPKAKPTHWQPLPLPPTI